MKISETKIETKQFEPITLNITFESKEELEYFYGIVNAPDSVAFKYAENKCNTNKWNDNNLSDFTFALFRWVNDKLDALR